MIYFVDSKDFEKTNNYKQFLILQLFSLLTFKNYSSNI